MAAFSVAPCLSDIGVVSASQEAPLTAARLVARVIDGQRTSGFRIRAKLTRVAPGAAPAVRQIVIKGRREGRATTVLCQVLWPEAAAGQAVLVEDRDQRSPTGFLFEPPDGVVPLSAATLAHPLFGSDLAVEDLVDPFWDWPAQRLAGRDVVNGRACLVVESRPAAGASDAYVRSCVSPGMALPLRIEKFGRDGRLLRRLIAARLMKRGEHWAAATMAIEPGAGGSRTTMEVSKAERNLTLPASAFTLDAVRAFSVR